MTLEVVIVDYGIVNLRNIQHGFEHLDIVVTSSTDPEYVRKANALVLPGVGAFKKGMEGLVSRHLDEAILDCVHRGNRLLGICLGMQLLMTKGTEYGVTSGLGLIDGVVEKIASRENGKRIRKIPHIGWNAIFSKSNSSVWTDTYLRATEQFEQFYFVHSYQVIPRDHSRILAFTHYDGIDINSAICDGNVTGVQFHPERSGQAGLQILKTFASD